MYPFSGSVSAVVGAYLGLFPSRRIGMLLPSECRKMYRTPLLLAVSITLAMRGLFLSRLVALVRILLAADLC